MYDVAAISVWRVHLSQLHVRLAHTVHSAPFLPRPVLQEHMAQAEVCKPLHVPANALQVLFDNLSNISHMRIVALTPYSFS